MSLPKITDFEVKGKRKQEIVVLLDGEPWWTFDPETVVKCSLKRGMALSEEAQARLIGADQALRARRAGAGYCARGGRTRRELQRYLKEKKYPAAAVESAIEALLASGTLDEMRTTIGAIRKRRKAGQGPRRIEAELIARGIAPKEAKGRLADALEGVDLQQECEAAARKAGGRYKPLSDAAQRLKLTQFLLRRGYEGDMVTRVVAVLRKERGVRGREIQEEIEGPD